MRGLARFGARLAVWLGVLCACATVAATPAFAEVGEPSLAEADAAIVLDAAGHVLYGRNVDEQFVPASITKLMTAVCALDSGIPLDEQITLRAVDFPDEPAAQKANLPEGATISFGDLLRVMLVYSANDCAVMVGEAVSGSEAAFVDVMNAKAAELGLTETHYANTHGLEREGHLTSARDQAELGRYALLNYPLIAQAVDMPSVTVNVGGQDYTFETTDALLGSYPGAMGIKTGQVESGVTFLGAVRQENATLYSCVLGCDTSEGRFADTRALWDWAYGAYEHETVASPAIAAARFRYPLRFGWDIAATSPDEVVALAWPDFGRLATDVKMAPETSAFFGGERVGAALWTQDDRTLAACGYEARGLVGDASASHDPVYETLILRGLPGIPGLPVRV